MRPAILCDLDGTLAHISPQRHPYDAHLCGLDEVNRPVALVLSWAGAAGYAVVLVSGRGFHASHRTATEQWLTWNGIAYDVLLMRPECDARPDYVVKAELYERHIADNYQVAFVLDDRGSVCRMWREQLGLTVFRVDERLD